jgi:hypothetical protein
MSGTRERYQQGSLRKVMRKSGAEVWEYRYRAKNEPGSPMRHSNAFEYLSSRASISIADSASRTFGYPVKLPHEPQMVTSSSDSLAHFGQITLGVPK